MVKVHLPVIGDGTDESPYRVEYPTYQLVEIDYGAMMAVIDVPASTLPLDFQPQTDAVQLKDGDLRKQAKGADGKLTGPRSPGPKHENVIVAAGADDLEAWHEHLDTMYAEHAGRFRPLAS